VSQIHARQRLYRRNRQSLVHGFDPVLTTVVGLLLFVGTLLVWAATRDWYTRNGLDGQYYLKRHIINILIGLVAGEILGNCVGGFPSANNAAPGTTLLPVTPKSDS